MFCLWHLPVFNKAIPQILLLSQRSRSNMMNHVSYCIITYGLTKKTLNFLRYLLKTVIGGNQTTGIGQCRTEIETAQAAGFVIRKQGRPAGRAIIIRSFYSYPSEGSLYISAAMLDKLH